MKRCSIYPYALFLGLLALVAIIIIGCSSAPMRDVSTSRTARIFNPTPRADMGARREVPPPTQEELWIIGRDQKQQARIPGEDNIPGSGVLAAKAENETKLIPCPLKHTDVKASIAGYIA